MPDRAFGFGTLCLHAGQIPDAAAGARARSTAAAGAQRTEIWTLLSSS